jgi:hypothetical protein
MPECVLSLNMDWRILVNFMASMIYFFNCDSHLSSFIISGLDKEKVAVKDR